MSHLVISALILSFVALPSMAQEAAPASVWKHESEAAVVTTTGNTETESYSAKQKTSYTFDLNSLVWAGAFLQTKTSGVETAKSWDTSLRYERSLTDQWSLYGQYGAEANPYGGVIQRDNADLGGKYYFVKKPKNEFFAELGARSSRTYSATGTVGTEALGRLYVEYTAPVTESTNFKLWVEYLPNFTNADNYRWSAEPSLSVAMSENFSLKAAYLARHDNAFAAPKKKLDTTSTLALVAKF